MSSQHDIVPTQHRAKNELVSTRRDVNTTSCQYDTVPTRRRVKAALCEDDDVMGRHRAKTTPCQNGVASKQHPDSTAPCLCQDGQWLFLRSFVSPDFQLFFVLIDLSPAICPTSFVNLSCLILSFDLSYVRRWLVVADVVGARLSAGSRKR